LVVSTDAPLLANFPVRLKGRRKHNFFQRNPGLAHTEKIALKYFFVGGQADLVPEFFEALLLVHIVQHPDAAGTFFHGQHQLVLVELRFDEVYRIRHHAARVLEAAAGNEMNRLSVGRPARFVLPMLTAPIK